MARTSFNTHVDTAKARNPAKAQKMSSDSLCVFAAFCGFAVSSEVLK
jgi:hypothetical protein